MPQSVNITSGCLPFRTRAKWQLNDIFQQDIFPSAPLFIDDKCAFEDKSYMQHAVVKVSDKWYNRLQFYRKRQIMEEIGWM